jgi:RimJ/RimL family protein N-acetyltransferase
MTTLTIPYPDHVMLFGGSPLLIKVAKLLRELNLHVDIYTSPRQEAEVIDGELTLGQHLVAAGMDWYHVTDDINRDLGLEEITPTTLGLGLGEAWQFSPEIVDVFGGRLIDVMGIPLPRYRGGAHYTWAIMNGEIKWGCCLQQVTPQTKQGVYDNGAIVMQRAYDMGYTAIYPDHWFEDCGKQELEMIQEFLLAIRKGAIFLPGDIAEKDSLYFPRLKTSENGWVNWNWGSVEIANFINAFDQPYPGAHTTINGRTVQLRCSDSIDGAFHPYANGLIVRISKDEITVASHTGTVLVAEVWCDGKVINKELRPGMRFVTSPERLHQAITYTPEYTAMGVDTPAKPTLTIKGKKVRLRPLTLSDCTERYVDWLNDPEINQYLESRFHVQTLDGIRRFVSGMQRSESNHLLGIFENESGTHIGNIKVGGINWHHRYADVGYFIGEKKLWGRGFATEAIRLATKLAFQELKLHRIHAGVYESNVGSCKALRKAGYECDGIWHDQLKGKNGWEGHVWFSCLETAYVDG